VSRLLIPFQAITFIKDINKIGFINKNNELTHSTLVEPFAAPSEVFLIPSSDVFSTNEYQYYTKDFQTHFKQYFSLCFTITPKSNEKLKENEKEKNRGILQIFEIAATWSDHLNKKDQTKRFDVINQRLILNVNVTSEQSIQ
jgi:hypothetical protein